MKSNDDIRKEILPSISKDNVAREQFVKDFILDNKGLFGLLGDATVVFEKAVHRYNIITDALIFSELKGIIGIEIKTKNDSLSRLNKQLKAYRAVADFAWVMCHDKHVDKVEKIIDDNGHIGVGIMSYTEFEGTLIVGVIRDANTSPYKDARVVLDMLWKSELKTILSPIRNGLDVFEYIKNHSSFENKHSGGGGIENHGASVTGSAPKRTIIEFIIGYLGTANASQLVCDMFRLGIMDASKVINRHYFRVLDKNKLIERSFIDDEKSR